MEDVEKTNFISMALNSDPFWMISKPTFDDDLTSDPVQKFLNSRSVLFFDGWRFLCVFYS